MGDDEAGRDGVYADAVRRILLGARHGQIDHPGLGGVVCPHPGQRYVGGHRRDVDDAAAHAAGDPERGGALGGHHQPGDQVEAQHFLEQGHVDVVEGALAAVAANPVEQHRGSAERRCGRLQSGIHRRLVAGVRQHAAQPLAPSGIAAQLLDGGVHRLLPAAPDRHPRAGVQERLGQGQGDGAASAGQCHDLIVQTEGAFDVAHVCHSGYPSCRAGGLSPASHSV